MLYMETCLYVILTWSNDLITKEQFLNYRKVQMRGNYNMITYAVAAMKEIGLSRNEYIDILKNYSKYMVKFNINKYG